MKFILLDTGSNHALWNMQYDRNLLKTGKNPVLHVYLWAEPALTYGYFLDLKKHLVLEKLEKQGVHPAKRPTGGGIVFHEYDYAFSLFFPKGSLWYDLSLSTLYQEVNLLVSRGLERIGVRAALFDRSDAKDSNRFFCMAKPVSGDLMLEGKKILGAAVRKTREGILYQGMISLKKLPQSLETCFLCKSSYEAIQYEGGFLIKEATLNELDQLRAQLKQILIEKFIR